MLAALADGTSRIAGYLSGADCLATLACMRSLGVRIDHRPGDELRIEGRGVGGLVAPRAPLDAANSGTTMRLLAGIAAAHRFRSVLDGDASLARRPMRRVIEPLTLMGAAISSQDGRPPLVIDGAPLGGISFRPAIPSAQVKSAVLLAGLHAAGETTVVEPLATRDHTERALQAFGVRVDRDDGQVHISGGQRLQGRELTVPGDISSAAFWMALAAGTPGAEVYIESVGLNPTRTGVLEIVRRAGALVDADVNSEAAGEPTGRIRVTFGSPRSFTIQADEVPGVIDEIPALAALGALMPPGAEMFVTGAGELRVKESDRIACLARGFRTLGALVEEQPDGFRLVSGPLTGSTVDAQGDHRLAMAFAIAATAAKGPTAILGASSVDVSYPGFFGDLERLTR